MREARLLWRIGGPQRRWMALGTGVGLLAGLATVGLLTVGGGLLALCALTGLSTPGLWNPAVGRFSAGIRFFAIGRTLGRYGERIFTHDATLRVLSRLRVWFFTRLAARAPGGLEQERIRGGDLLERLVADVDALAAFYIRVASPWVWGVALVAILGAFLAWLDPALALAATSVLLVGSVVGLPWLGGRWCRTRGRAVAAQGRQLRVRLLEALQGREELLVYGAAESHCERLRSEAHAWLRSQERFAARVALLQALGLVVAGLGLAATLALGALAAQREGLSPTALAAAVLAVITAFEVVSPLAATAPDRERVREATARLEAVVDAPPGTPPPAEPTLLPSSLEIQLQGVSFHYEDPASSADAPLRPAAELRDGPAHSPPAALRGLDLRILQGQHVAILGPSGAGKTTLVHLLTRLRDPDAGQVRLGGTDLRSLCEAELRRQVTAVEQRAHLFSATLRDNLRLGRPDADDDALREVLARARLPLDPATFPQGLDTWLSGTGDPGAAAGARRLSGGEARRIALARALLRDPPVLILDEPTEDLDPPTARRLLTDLLAERQGRTLVLITHRRAALKRAHRVLLLERGRLVEQGSHEELLAAGGRYATRWRRLGLTQR